MTRTFRPLSLCVRGGAANVSRRRRLLLLSGVRCYLVLLLFSSTTQYKYRCCDSFASREALFRLVVLQCTSETKIVVSTTNKTFLFQFSGNKSTPPSRPNGSGCPIWVAKTTLFSGRNPELKQWKIRIILPKYNLANFLKPFWGRPRGPKQTTGQTRTPPTTATFFADTDQFP